MAKADKKSIQSSNKEAPAMENVLRVKAVTRLCYVARDKTGGLVGVYEEKPTEIQIKDPDPKEQKKYFTYAPMVLALPYETFRSVFKIELKEGECFSAELSLSLEK